MVKKYTQEENVLSGRRGRQLIGIVCHEVIDIQWESWLWCARAKQKEVELTGVAGL